MPTSIRMAESTEKKKKLYRFGLGYKISIGTLVQYVDVLLNCKYVTVRYMSVVREFNDFILCYLFKIHTHKYQHILFL